MSPASRGAHQGAQRSPKGTEHELAKLALRNRIIRPRIATSLGQVVIANGVTAPFVSFVGGAQSEGLVIGWNFWTPMQPQDYVTNPVLLGRVGLSALEGLGANQSLVPDAWDVFTLGLAPRGQAFEFPGDGWGYYFERGQAPCLAWKNASGADQAIEGFLVLLTWAEADRAQALRHLRELEKDRSGPVFPERIFT